MVGLLVWMAWIAALEPPPEPPPEPAPEVCELQVLGLPVPAMSHHALGIDDEPGRPLRPTMTLLHRADPMHLRVLGPRFVGEQIVQPEQCEPGKVVKLQVVPLPASLSFGCAPERTTVVCRNCPASVGDRVHTAEEFPAVPMSDVSRELELLLRAPGFRPHVLRVTVYPGPNTVPIHLEPL